MLPKAVLNLGGRQIAVSSVSQYRLIVWETRARRHEEEGGSRAIGRHCLAAKGIFFPDTFIKVVGGAGVGEGREDEATLSSVWNLQRLRRSLLFYEVSCPLRGPVQPISSLLAGQSAPHQPPWLWGRRRGGGGDQRPRGVQPHLLWLLGDG